MLFVASGHKNNGTNPEERGLLNKLRVQTPLKKISLIEDISKTVLIFCFILFYFIIVCFNI